MLNGGRRGMLKEWCFPSHKGAFQLVSQAAPAIYLQKQELDDYCVFPVPRSELSCEGQSP
jgi:hypothetical protein